MTERIPKVAYLAAAGLGVLLVLMVALRRPGYVTTDVYLGGMVLLELLAAAVWMYRKVFFPLVLGAFLFAGVDLPVGAFWTQARWLFLILGAVVGSLQMLKERSHSYGLFHFAATFAVLASLVSAAVSQYPSVALLKALSFALLFLYAATGARLAVTGRESQFFTGLLTGLELFVGATAMLYAVGIEAMGNPNSLGAVMAVAAAPILLWGALLDEPRWVHRRRWVSYGICMCLIFYSHSRAGMGAALISSGLLCLALRKYRMVASGTAITIILLAAGAILRPEAMSRAASMFTTSVVFKNSGEGGLLASRESPWKAALDTINNHFWFGTGLGTAENPAGPTGKAGMFSSSSQVSTENGSSYLAILAGNGMIGTFPFLILLLWLLGAISRTFLWIWSTGNPCHPAVPLAMVALTGLIHAGFEDWLFAPGYYLCVFYWSLAFVFMDNAPLSAPRISAMRFRAMPRGLGGVASNR